MGVSGDLLEVDSRRFLHEAVSSGVFGEIMDIWPFFYYSLTYVLYYFHLVRINLPLFSTVIPSIICMFLSCRPFVVITTLSTGLVGVEVN